MISSPNGDSTHSTAGRSASAPGWGHVRKFRLSVGLVSIRLWSLRSTATSFSFRRSISSIRRLFFIWSSCLDSVGTLNFGSTGLEDSSSSEWTDVVKSAFTYNCGNGFCHLPNGLALGRLEPASARGFVTDALRLVAGFVDVLVGCMDCMDCLDCLGCPIPPSRAREFICAVRDFTFGLRVLGYYTL